MSFRILRNGAVIHTQGSGAQNTSSLFGGGPSEYIDRPASIATQTYTIEVSATTASLQAQSFLAAQ